MTKTFLLLTTSLAVLSAAVFASQSQDHHAQMNARGGKAMGFDQTATTHHFYLYEDGGAIQVTVINARDAENLAAIRSHLPHISTMFAAGDFSAPLFVHDQTVPGTETMMRLRERISYAYSDMPAGGRVRITTRDPQALSAVHDFLRYQITDHKTGDPVHVTRVP
jgi:hypothetical protein